MDGEKGQAEMNFANGQNRRLFLIVSASVMMIALAVSTLLIIGGEPGVERVIDFGSVLNGISVNGVDISGMTEEEAREATSGIPSAMLKEVEFTLDVNGEEHTYIADDFNVETDYENVMAQAVAYGRRGTFDERKKAADTAKAEGADFTVNLSVEETTLQSALAALKQELDTPAQDAAAIFMPCGYTADGTPYEPDPTEMADAHSHFREYEGPELVRIDSADMPSGLRYLFWDDDHYVDDYKPRDANIRRFLYTPEVTGIAADTDAIFDEIMAQVKSGEFSTVTVPTEVTEAEVKLEDVQNDTQLIASWTSSYRTHDSSNRVWNVSRMSSYINGNEIAPGEPWSVNDTAGLRTSKTAREIGWKQATGLAGGGETPQYGGGVCQLGSTTYNAALRAGMTINDEDFDHHSVPSSYIPLGLDATLSSPTPDLVLHNDADTPVYLVSYIEPKKKTVTVEVYGRLPYDEEYGQQVIYDFTSDNKGTHYGSPRTQYIYKNVALDGTVLSPERPEYVFGSGRRGTAIQVYKHVYALDGTPLCDPIEYEYHKYPVKDRVIYVYDGPMPTDPPETSEPPAESTEPPAESTEPPAESTEPPAESTEPPAESTEPPA